MRTMQNEFRGIVFYRSSFDPKTGALVRLAMQPRRTHSIYGLRDELFEEIAGHTYDEKLTEEWQAKFGWRNQAFSPVPETLDISITDWCNFGCSYCYQDSTERQQHADKTLVEKVIKSFDQAPYQVAIGGGEPTAHPDFPEILFRTRELGSVPNYTTAGHIFRDDVIAATNEVCGGVSLTFHAFKGLDWFAERYSKLRAALRVQLNVHLIADRDVVVNLDALTKLQARVGPLSLVLLAYYPDVGRGSMARIMPKQVYLETFPAALKRAIDADMKIAFSEGLLPFFISRPEIGVDTRYATASEGLFSAYVDPRGRMSHSSFSPPSRDDSDDRWPSVLAGALLQAQWNKGFDGAYGAHGGRCGDCAEQVRCATPSVHHYFACAYAEHNGKQPPLTPAAKRNAETNRVLDDWHAKERELGRKLTDEEIKPFTDRLRARPNEED